MARKAGPLHGESQPTAPNRPAGRRGTVRNPARRAASDALLRALTEGSIEAIAITRDRHVLQVNQAFADIFGYATPDELVGRDVIEFVAEHDRERLAGYRAARLRGQPSPERYQYEGVRKDGLPVWIDQRATLIERQGEQTVLCTLLDITAEKRRAIELAEKSALLDAILESLPVGLSVVDQDLRIVVQNQQAATMYDLPLELTRPGRTFEAIIRYNAERGEYGPGDPDEQVRQRVELARRFLPHHMERQRPDGRWLEVHGNPMPGGGFISVTTDVTERKRMETALADSERLLQTAFDSLPVWISVKDRDGRYLFCNQRMLDDLELRREQLLGQKALEITVGTPEDRQRWHDLDLQVIATGLPAQVIDADFTLPNGRSIIQRYIKVPLRGARGDTTGIVSVVQDVTEQRRAETALEQFKSTLDRTLDCVFMFDPESLRFVYVNRGARHQVGYSEEELLNMTPLHIKPEFDDATFRALIEPLKRGERDSLTFETAHRTSEGESVPVEVFLQYVVIESGAPRFVAIVRDISERNRLEAQLRQSQKLEAVGTLAGGIAHDFNNALVPILGYTQMLLERTDPESKEARWLQIVTRSAERARDLVAQILLYSRQSISNRSLIDLVPITSEVVKFLRSSLPSSIDIVDELPDAAWADADAVQLHQVLMNLCINAGQSMPDGGRLRIALETLDVAGRTSFLGRPIEGRYHRFTVTDSGTGMDADTLSHIFEPFFTTKPVGQGTGLGLSMVLGIVERHGGAVRVQSEVGVGTTFEVYIPAALASSLVAGPLAESRATGHERILVVDDEEAVVDVARALLSWRGYQVTGFQDSREALRAFQEHPDAYDLVISDWTMPHFTGDKLAEQMQAIAPRLPIILCTGYGDDAVPESFTRGTLGAVVRKPFNTEELARLVRRLLDEARSSG